MIHNLMSFELDDKDENSKNSDTIININVARNMVYI